MLSYLQIDIIDAVVDGIEADLAAAHSKVADIDADLARVETKIDNLSKFSPLS